MSSESLDQQLHQRLLEFPEINASGFRVREGLTGAGVTVIKGHSYFGSWRVTAGTLGFVSANMADGNFFAESVEDAVRYTLLVILRSLEHSHRAEPLRAMAG